MMTAFSTPPEPSLVLSLPALQVAGIPCSLNPQTHLAVWSFHVAHSSPWNPSLSPQPELSSWSSAEPSRRETGSFPLLLQHSEFKCYSSIYYNLLRFPNFFSSLDWKSPRAGLHLLHHDRSRCMEILSEKMNGEDTYRVLNITMYLKVGLAQTLAWSYSTPNHSAAIPSSWMTSVPLRLTHLRCCICPADLFSWGHITSCLNSWDLEINTKDAQFSGFARHPVFVIKSALC